MKRLIVTGANGTGKSYVAKRLGMARPEVSVFSYDGIRLKENWIKRSQSEINEELLRIIEAEEWVLEGGPSLLAQALTRADGVIWLDPPELLRAWRLAIRPWQNRGKTRPELPTGNVDWPLKQYRFAFHSLKNRAKFREHIEACLREHSGLRVWHCRLQSDVEEAIQACVDALS